MKQILVLSGKGGTGKTSVTAALADLASADASLVLADADVDAANLELVLQPEREETTPFEGGSKAVIDGDLCTDCGVCADVCRFDAVMHMDQGYKIDPVACEGCAACYYQCPVDAITMVPAQAGEWYRSRTRLGPLFHARLFPGEENSGKLVATVKQHATLWATKNKADYVLTDGPPGIGCPVIAATSGTELALLVTEPTVSGIHDLERILDTVTHFGVKAAVVVNKWDLKPERADEINAFCRERGLSVVGRIPYDEVVTRAMVSGQPVTAVTDGPVTAELHRIWRAMVTMLGA
ncbi:MAG: ATP-binding protein [Anaerolineae bacterium]